MDNFTKIALNNINKAIDVYVNELDHQFLQDEISEEYLEEKMHEIHKSIIHINKILK
jgi:hypothetical protein